MHKTYPKTLHHLVFVNTKFLGVAAGKLADGESPAVKTGTEGNGTLFGVHLDITKSLVEVGRNDNVDRLNDTREVLVQVFLGELELEQSAVDLVNDDNRLDALTESLTEHSLGLDANTFDGVNDNKSTIGDTESSRDFGGEVNVTGRVDQVDQEAILLRLGGNVLEVLGVAELSVQGDGGRLDGDTTLLLIGTSVGITSASRLGGRDNTGTLNERIGEGRLSVVDYGRVSVVQTSASACHGGRGGLPRWALTVGNDRHVTDVLGVIHEITDLSAWSASIAPPRYCGHGRAMPCPRGVHGTYLFDREAGILLATPSTYSQQARDVAVAYLTMMAVLSIGFY